MKIIVCVAKNNGILFNKRRVSRDRAVVEDIISNTPNIKLSDYSKELFANQNLTDSDDVYTFIEEEFTEIEDVSEIILYRWNRDYPADVFFKFNKNSFKLQSSIDFAGNSHERITKEIWTKK